MEQDKHTDEQIHNFLSMRKVAVIGMSKNSSKAAHYVPKYLLENGYDITPVNPTTVEILGKKCYDSVSEIDDEMDVKAACSASSSSEIKSVVTALIKFPMKSSRVSVALYWYACPCLTRFSKPFLFSRSNVLWMVFNVPPRCLLK